MATHWAAPASGAFMGLHSRPLKRHKRHGSDVIKAVVITVLIAAGLSCLVFCLDSDSLALFLAPPSGGGGVATVPPVPTKQRQERPRRAAPARRQPGGDDPSAGTSSAAWLGASADAYSEMPPWSPAAAKDPFLSDQPAKARGKIDELVFADLAKLGLQPAQPCSDEVFVRRVYIDLLGTLPTPDEARRFLDDAGADKRAQLIDELFERPEFADYWAMKWADLLRVKAEFPIKLWPNAAQAYHRWIRAAIKNNLPYDEFARQLLTSSGSNFRTPQVNFYRAVQAKEPKALAQAVALTFLGQRAERWAPERLEGLSIFFSQVGYKPTGEWKEEIVYFDRRKGAKPGSQALAALLPDGTQAQIPAGQDPRKFFAEWLTQDSKRWFSRAIANRVWSWLLGRGIIDPPDDIRSENPAVNPALLDHLASELVAARYDLRQLYRLILNSQTYQLACLPSSQDPRASEHFACYSVRRLDAEVLIDALCQITGTHETYSSIIPEPYTFLPEGQRAIALPDGSITSSFLEMFGRPPRDTGIEAERNNRLSAAQALHLLNSNHLRHKLRQGPGIAQLLNEAPSNGTAAELLYLAILSRRPTDEEQSLVAGLCESPAGAQEVAWALINSDEFLFRH